MHGLSSHKRPPSVSDHLDLTFLGGRLWEVSVRLYFSVNLDVEIKLEITRYPQV